MSNPPNNHHVVTSSGEPLPDGMRESKDPMNNPRAARNQAGSHVRSNVAAVEAGQRTAKADREAYYIDKIGDGKNVTLADYRAMDMQQRVMLKQANAAKYRDLADADHFEGGR